MLISRPSSLGTGHEGPHPGQVGLAAPAMRDREFHVSGSPRSSDAEQPALMHGDLVAQQGAEEFQGGPRRVGAATEVQFERAFFHGSFLVVQSLARVGISHLYLCRGISDAYELFAQSVAHVRGGGAHWRHHPRRRTCT